MSFTPSQAFRDARLVGGILAALDDHPTNHAYAVIYDGSAVVLTTLVFTKPVAALVSHELVFDQEDSSGDFIVAQGNAASFELYSGGNVLMGTGTVTDMAGAGPLKISGTTGTLLYAGARAILGTLKCT